MRSSKPVGKTKSQRKQAEVGKLIEATTFKIPPLKACNTRQKQLHSSFRNNPFVIATGPAGVGKSYVGAHAACQMLIEGKIDKIILTRNPLPTGTSLGFFAGSEQEKMSVWLGPIVGTIKKILKTNNNTDSYFEYLVSKGFIVYQPLEVIKGSSFDRTFIFVEEAQELTMEQLKVISTRIGEGSVLFLNGDIKQNNSRNGSNKGFKEFVEMIKKENSYSHQAQEEWDKIQMPVYEFTVEEIVRSDVVRKIVTMLDKNNL